MVGKKNSEALALAVAINDISTIKEDVREIKTKLDSDYITCEKLEMYKERLSRIEKIVYGVVGILLTAIILALVKLVVLQ